MSAVSPPAPCMLPWPACRDTFTPSDLLPDVHGLVLPSIMSLSHHSVCCLVLTPCWHWTVPRYISSPSFLSSPALSHCFILFSISPLSSLSLTFFSLHLHSSSIFSLHLFPFLFYFSVHISNFLLFCPLLSFSMLLLISLSLSTQLKSMEKTGK